MIRPATEADLDACAAIVTSLPLFRSYGQTVERARSLLGRALADDLRVCDDGGVRGFAWVVPYGTFGRSAYLKQIAVAADAQGQRVGARLLEAHEATHLVPNGMTLLVTATNIDAQRFYERCGYLRVGVLPKYAHPDHDEVLYFKTGRITT